MKEITITKWEAFDGAVFDDDSKCIEYEDERLEHLTKDEGIIFLDRDREDQKVADIIGQGLDINHHNSQSCTMM